MSPPPAVPASKAYFLRKTLLVSPRSSPLVVKRQVHKVWRTPDPSTGSKFSLPSSCDKASLAMDRTDRQSWADGTPRGISGPLLPRYFCENSQRGPATFLETVVFTKIHHAKRCKHYCDSPTTTTTSTHTRPSGSSAVRFT